MTCAQHNDPAANSPCNSPCGQPRQRPSASRRQRAPLARAAREQLHGELEGACALHHTFCRRDRLGLELARLERLQQLALLWPRQWQRCIAPCRESLALWLYGVALGVAGLGLHEAALALLDTLPGIAAGAAGRRALLRGLLTQAAASSGAANDAAPCATTLRRPAAAVGGAQ